MDTPTVNTTAPAAELVSPQEVTVDPFTTYLQGYLIGHGLDEAFIKENITSQVILDSLRENQDTTLGPARSVSATFALKNSDRVCTGHLQRYLIDNGFKPEFANQVTGPHIKDSIIDVLPEHLLPKTPTNQAASAPASTSSTGKAPRKDSAFATNSDASEVDDEDEDLPTRHRRMSRAKYIKDSRNGRITKRIKKNKPRQTLDLSKTYHKIQAACLASLELSEDSTFNLNVSSPEYTDFLRDCSSFLVTRLAAISVTLARTDENKKAADFGQFGLDLLGPALFTAALAVCEASEEEKEGMLYSKMCVPECFDEISAQWDVALAKELAAMAKGHGMWSV